MLDCMARHGMLGRREPSCRTFHAQNSCDAAVAWQSRGCQVSVKWQSVHWEPCKKWATYFCRALCWEGQGSATIEDMCCALVGSWVGG